MHPVFLSSRMLSSLTLCYLTSSSAVLDRDVRELPDHREGLIVSLAEWCVARPVDDNSVDASRRRSYGFFDIISQENDFLGGRVQCIADLLVALFDDFRPGGNSIELAYKVGV